MSLPVKVSRLAAKEIIEIQRYLEEAKGVPVFVSGPTWSVAFRSYSNIPQERKSAIGIIDRSRLKPSTST